jgi:hypothetical protein
MTQVDGTNDGGTCLTLIGRIFLNKLGSLRKNILGRKGPMDNGHDKSASVNSKRILAQRVAVITGAIAECDNHPCSFVNMNNPDAEETALTIATSVFSKGGNGGLIFQAIFNDSKDMVDMITRVISESASTCPSCTAITCKVARTERGR